MEATLNALRGGRDVLQGMSNAAAGAVSVPVDVLAWALRKAGVPVGDEPVGGSDWMKRKGLTREPENRVAGVIGESIGGVLPMVASAKAPQIAAGVNHMIDNAMAPRRMNPQAGAIVWHGSPHKFTRFDSSKIGTGEGAQAYGHGLYTAEARDVAKQYADNVKDMGAVQRVNAEMSRLAKIMSADEVPGAYRKYRSDVGRKAAEQYDALMAQRDQVRTASGNLYKIDLPDEAIGRMLDWDKPLYRQKPEVRKAVRELVDEKTQPGKYAQWVKASRPDMRTLQNDMLDSMDNSAISEALRGKGIPGIRYLDQGSRAAGHGTSNYVVFPGNEDLLKILEINDQPVQAVIDALRNKR